MSGKYAIACGVTLLILVVSWIGFKLTRSEELGSKVEWSVVQSVEFNNRGKITSEVALVPSDDYLLAVVPVENDTKNVVILLNPRSAPFYKQLPVGNYELYHDELKMIEATGKVNSTVINCLESHLREGKRAH